VSSLQLAYGVLLYFFLDLLLNFECGIAVLKKIKPDQSGLIRSGTDG
jgi:hypothetical protein